MVEPFRIDDGLDDAGRNRGDKLAAGVLVMISIIAAIIGISYLEDDPLPGVYSSDVDDCLSGETTPEDLGYPEMSCEDIEEAYNSSDSAASAVLPCLTSLCCGPIGIYMMLNLAKKSGTPLEVRFAAAERESELLKEQIHAMRLQLMDAEDGYQEAIEEQRRAEERHREFERERRDLSVPSELNDAAVGAHRARIAELEASAASAMADIEAARIQVAEAERAKAEALEVADEMRTTEEVLRRKTESIDRSPVSINIQYKERIYRDSVHQEKRQSDDEPEG